MAQRREDMRAADSDRQYVADQLKDALNAGRLDLGEYDERLQQAYAARTYGELDRLLHDLPGVTPPEQAQLAPANPPTAAPVPGGAPAGPRVQPWLVAMWGGWLTTSAICFVIWALTGAGMYPWPLWVAGPWGVLLLVKTLQAIASGDPAGFAAGERDRDRRRRQERWDRRHERWERRRYR